MTAKLITADASKVSPLEFIDAIGLSSPEKREARRKHNIDRCIQAIEAGDTYGFPPALVEECKAIQATERDLRFTMELQGKDAA